mmetsp:Transcript_39574/g.85507  ORF Transcript_39574/g.85507 Transcript_39574/m.85507 type:complete len:211 (+) Transcript_39574:110-742(+)
MAGSTCWHPGHHAAVDILGFVVADPILDQNVVVLLRSVLHHSRLLRLHIAFQVHPDVGPLLVVFSNDGLFAAGGLVDDSQGPFALLAALLAELLQVLASFVPPLHPNVMSWKLFQHLCQLFCIASCTSTECLCLQLFLLLWARPREIGSKVVGVFFDRRHLILLVAPTTIVVVIVPRPGGCSCGASNGSGWHRAFLLFLRNDPWYCNLLE